MEATIQLSPRHRNALTVFVMAAMLMQVIDTTIANVALPHMQAALGASPETVSWVLTSYIVAAAITLPLTGWLESRIGRHNLLFIAIGGFTVASMLCGMALSLPAMVGARIVQGIFGAFLGPLSQSVMLDIYSLKERPKAMTISSMVLMVGPVVGPILGGYLTELYNWRWIFFVNLPIGIASLVGAFLLMPRERTTRRPFDAFGFAVLALGLASLQLLLDRGTQEDWFESTEIVIEAALAVAMLWIFAVHTITSPQPLIPRRVFTDRNLLIANLFMVIVVGVIYSSAALLPPMLQHLFGHDSVQVGLLMTPRAFTMMFAMVLSPMLMRHVDSRLMVVSGMLLVSISLWMMSRFSPEMDDWPVITSGLIQGLGVGMVLVPMQLLAYSTLPAELRTSGASYFNLTRSLGGSVAIAVFMAITARNLQVSHSDLAAHIDSIRFAFLQSGFSEQAGMNSEAVLSMLDLEVNRQAMMIAYIDDFWLLGVLCFVLMPLGILVRLKRATRG